MTVHKTRFFLIGILFLSSMYFMISCSDPCADIDCGVNGVCVLGTCDCDAGYTGDVCEINIDECAVEPCAVSTCIDGIASYTCDCQAAYLVTDDDATAASNPTLVRVSITDLAECDLFSGSLVIKESLLTSLAGIGTFTSMGDLEISYNDLLTSFSGLGNLASAGNLEIAYNDSLISLDGLESLSYISKLEIKNNLALTDLHGLATLGTVEGSFEVKNNPVLPTCEAEWLLDNIDFVGGPLFDIINNCDTCTCS